MEEPCRRVVAFGRETERLADIRASAFIDSATLSAAIKFAT